LIHFYKRSFKYVAVVAQTLLKCLDRKIIG